MESWDKQLEPIVNEFKDGNIEPLSEIEIDKIIWIIKSKLMLSEGLINEGAYNNRLNRLNDEGNR